MALEKNPGLCRAFYATVHEPLKPRMTADVLAAALGFQSVQDIYKLYTPDNTRYLRVEHVLAIKEVAGDIRVLEALCEEAGGCFVDLEPAARACGNVDIAAVYEKVGKLGAAAARAFRDDKVTSAELAAIKREVHEAIKNVLGLEKTAEAMTR